MKQVYRSTNARLYGGNCVQVIQQKVRPASVDLVFADPPYFLSGKGKTTVRKNKRVENPIGKWDEAPSYKKQVAFHAAWLDSCVAIMRNTASMFVTGTYHNIHIIGYLMPLVGLTIYNDIVWVKPNAPPNIAANRLQAAQEIILWAGLSDHMNQVKFNYNELRKNQWRGDPFSRAGRQAKSVWQVPVPEKDELRYGRYPTQKPEELLRRIILGWTDPSDLVLDPFHGSGTSGAVAVREKRRYIGIDKSRTASNIAVKRVMDEEQIAGNLGGHERI